MQSKKVQYSGNNILCSKIINTKSNNNSNTMQV